MERKNKGFLAAAVMVFIVSTMFFFKSGTSFALEDVWIDQRELGELCIAQAAPSAEEPRDENRTKSAADDGKTDQSTKQKVDDAEADDRDKGIETDETANVDAEVSSDPLVIIYHTHSSESYMPYKESNYHREQEEGTVRDVGNVLEKELEKKGIHVIHDKTIHDRPSYNESYARSLETIQRLAAEHPTAVYIIDLHRDAAASDARDGKYIEIDGRRVATFSMVVGKANENYPELYEFADKVKRKAADLHDGFGGAIIEKDYNYNEFISNRALLLEVGNNKNTIEEARLCGEYFAEVLAQVIKEEQ